MRRVILSTAILCVLLSCTVFAPAQSTWQPGHADIGFGKAPDKQWLRMVSSPDVTLDTGKKIANQDIALRFAIQSGLHINSHTPRSSFLIPTTLTFEISKDIQISRIEYPQGVDYHFEFSPKESVSVYTGEFPVYVHLHATRGDHIIHGQLRYQACDNRTCNPPKSLPLTLQLAVK